MKAKSIERIAEELGVNFYNLYPLIKARDEFHFKAGMQKVMEMNEVISQHLLQDAYGDLHIESRWLKAWFQARQAFLKENGLEGE